ncbi:insulin receptor-like [Ptychodera flava]|uniref:insulin receptor-like n=1 Tax=Ptychodera flava TaxID=63121 RepID=UPI003969ED2E
MIDTHVRQRFDVDVRLATKGSLKRPFSFGIVEMIYVGCPLNKYGGSCEYDCMCQNGATCHAWNGACQCDEGWRGPVCDIPMDPSVTLMISRQEVFYYSPVRLMCNFINVSPAELFFELNEKLLTEEEKTLVISNSIPGLTQLKIKNMTSEFEGSYRCNVSSKDPSIYAISNSLEVNIEGCQVGMWGNVCQHRCDCVNYINCSRYHGCMCHTGWSGEKCDRDTMAPIIQCPLNITKFVRDFSTKVNISWPNVRSTDNAGPPAVSANFRSGDLFEIGTTIVIYKAVDSSNNSASCIFAVTVNGPAYMNDKVTISSIGLLTIIFIAIVTLALVILFKKRKGHNYMPLREPRLSLCIPDEVPVFDRKEIVVGNIIGQGEFSMVHSGTLTVGNEKRNVAVKILKDDIEYQTAYQNEVTTLTLLSQCPHIIPLIGVITNWKSDKKMIITELMCTDMHSELKKLQQQYDSSLESGRRLMKFCCHVALALQHMEKTKVLHRDIAARNVLISNTDIAKIGDFGLARDIYQTAVYQRPPSKKNCRVPVRWMAPESLTNSVYTSSSDIWAFGVFLWETATLGGMPYDNIDIDELVRRLQNGYRLKKPQHCDEEFYTLMRRCWKWNPRDRITATMAVEVLFKLSKHEKGVFHTEGGHVHQSVYL